MKGIKSMKINNKKGFTLIELLAVIVILAIIALIAVPIILNIIDDSKESAVLVSGKNYVRAVEQQILSKNIKEKFSPQVCIIQEDGNLMCDGDKPFIVEVSGSKPTSGEIRFNNKKLVEVIEMILDDYVLEMQLNKELVVLGTISEVLEPPLNPQGTYLMKGVNTYGKSDVVFFNGTIKREEIETITFTYTNKVPSNVIGSWDVSEAQDGSVMAWYLDKDNNSLYELYIGGEGGVKANPKSSCLFSFFINLREIDVSYLDTSDVIDMSHMFLMSNTVSGEDSKSKLTNIIGLNVFNTSKVTDMSYMFASSNQLSSLDVSSFDTSQVTNMKTMFGNCANLTSLDISHFNTSKVTDMSYMFSTDSSGFSNTPYSTGKLTSIIGLNNLDTSNVTNMSAMFRACPITNLNLSSFDTSKVTDMTYMFSGCTVLTTLNLSNFNVNNVTKMDYMFTTGDSKLTIVYVKDSTVKTFIESRLAERNITGVTVTIS